MSATPALPEPDEDGVIRTTATIAGQTYHAKINLTARIVTIATGTAITDQLAELINHYHPIVAEMYPNITLTPAHAAMSAMSEITAMAILGHVEISTTGVATHDETDLDHVIGTVERVLDPSWVTDRIDTAYDLHAARQ
jgi:hypothetical protein